MEMSKRVVSTYWGALMNIEKSLDSSTNISAELVNIAENLCEIRSKINRHPNKEHLIDVMGEITDKIKNIWSLEKDVFFDFCVISELFHEASS